MNTKQKENKSTLRLIFKHQRWIHKARKNGNHAHAAHCLDNMKAFMFFYNQSSENPISFDELCAERNKIPFYKR